MCPRTLGRGRFFQYGMQVVSSLHRGRDDAVLIDLGRLVVRVGATQNLESVCNLMAAPEGEDSRKDMCQCCLHESRRPLCCNCCSMRLSSSLLPLQATSALAQPLPLPSRTKNCKRRAEQAKLPDKQQRPRWRNLPFFALKNT
ncbi:hypothetical protein IscW_ISCW022456 [Ixodes scapularis]|uniref:Uncharacterized protein n=1 Tax=Ixodes scapularis TaxID=6945 RepID=B7QAQ9_IXOSC|nr:hypothetical protein IscW_ISCW022456 [Ixodes scapularis]|eukprot:XP_002412635.1 hypothetical protein IscW_ISCW022456 [Ixodes scapularis]